MSERKRVLLADDNADMRTLCRIILEEQDFEVTEAVDGDSTLAAVSADRPDLVVLDIMMPGLSGWGVVAAMRQDPELAKIPILILTARFDDDFRERAAQLRVPYMTKPFQNRDFVNQIRHAMFGRDSWS